MTKEWREWLVPALASSADTEGPASTWRPLLPVRKRRLYGRSRSYDTRVLRYFVRSPVRRWFAQCVWFLNGLLPEWHGNFVQMSAGASSAMQHLVPTEWHAVPVLIQFGSPGPYQKVIVLCHDPSKQPLISKVAICAPADRLLEIERDWLLRLNELPELRASVPSLVQAGRLPSGRQYLSMEAILMGPSSRTFSAQHLQFLLRLHAASMKPYKWEVAPIRGRLQDRFARLDAMPSAGNLKVAQLAWSKVDQELRGQVVDTCIVHGDFAPWNVSLARGGITVFDWEYANDGGLPLHDFFHFHCIQVALSRKTTGHEAWLNDLVEAASFAFSRRTASATWPQVDLVIYLLDTISMYVEARGTIDTGDRVVSAYLAWLTVVGHSSAKSAA